MINFYQKKLNLWFFLIISLIDLSNVLSSGNLIKENLSNLNKKVGQSSLISILPVGDINFFDVQTNNCTIQKCSFPFGYCSSSTNCHCSYGYANVNLNYTLINSDSKTNNLYCNYSQKNQLTSFILEFIFPFGVGHFYALRNTFGLIKIMFVLVSPLLFCLLVCVGIIAMDSLNCQKFFAVISAGLGLIYTIGVVVWFLVDLVMFGLNKYKDGNGVPLKEW